MINRPKCDNGRHYCRVCNGLYESPRPTTWRPFFSRQACPELNRRDPIEFSRCLANARDLRKISPGASPEHRRRGRNDNSIVLRTRRASAVKAAESEKGTGNFFRKKVASPLLVLFSSLRTLRSLRLNLRFRIFFYVTFVPFVVKLFFRLRDLRGETSLTSSLDPTRAPLQSSRSSRRYRSA